MSQPLLWQYQTKAEPPWTPIAGPILKPGLSPVDVVVNARAATVAATFLVIASTTAFAYCPNPTPLGEMFKIDHEEGDFSDYDSVPPDAGLDLTIVQPGLAVTDNALKVHLLDTDDHYGKKHVDWRTDDLRVGLHLDLREIDYGSPTDYFQVWSLRNAASDIRAALYLANDPSNRVFWASVVDDTGLVRSLPLTQTSDNPHIETHIRRASSASASDGIFEMFVNGVSIASLTDLDLYDLDRPSELRVGPQDAVGTFSGSFLIDEIVVRDDTTSILPSSTMQWFMPTEQPLWSHDLLQSLYGIAFQGGHTGSGGPTEEVWYFKRARGGPCGEFLSKLPLVETPGTFGTTFTITFGGSWNRTEAAARSIASGAWTVVAEISSTATAVWDFRTTVRRRNAACTILETLLDVTHVVTGPVSIQELSFVAVGVPQVDLAAGDHLTVDMIALPRAGSSTLVLRYNGPAEGTSDSRLVHPLPALPAPDFSWVPSYADAVQPPPPLVPEAFTAGPLEDDVFTAPPLHTPVYPDIVRGPTPLVAEGAWTGVLEPRLFGMPNGAWLPVYPDQVPGRPPLLQEGYFAGVFDPDLLAIQNLDWLPETNQPVRVIPHLLHGQEATQHLAIETLVTDWIPPTEQPPAGRRPLTAEGYQVGVPWEDVFGELHGSWFPQSLLPPPLSPRALQAQWWVGVLEPTLLEAKNVSWMPETNQPPLGLAPLVAEGYWAGVLDPDVFGPGHLGWMPETNQPPRGRPPLVWQEWWSGVLEDAVFAAPPIDGWLSTYDDIVRGRLPLVPEGYWTGVLEDSLFQAITPSSTSYYRRLTIVRRWC